MSIVRARNLSASDLARLGNNVGDRIAAPQRRRKRRLIAGINRSLAVVGEQVSHLHRLSEYPGSGTTITAVA